MAASPFHIRYCDCNIYLSVDKSNFVTNHLQLKQIEQSIIPRDCCSSLSTSFSLSEYNLQKSNLNSAFIFEDHNVEFPLVRLIPITNRIESWVKLFKVLWWQLNDWTNSTTRPPGDAMMTFPEEWWSVSEVKSQQTQFFWASHDWRGRPGGQAHQG